jgi:hypothetical protein
MDSSSTALGEAEHTAVRAELDARKEANSP